MTWPAHDEFNTGTVPSSDWNAVYPAVGNTITVGNGYCEFNLDNGNNNGIQLLEWVAPVDDSGPWIQTFKLAAHLVGGNVAGIGLWDHVSGKALGFYFGKSGSDYQLTAGRWDSFHPNSFNGYDVSPSTLVTQPPSYFRVQYNGANYQWSWSVNGYDWNGTSGGDIELGNLFSDWPRTHFLPSGATNLFAFASTDGSGGRIKLLLDWVRPGSDVSDVTWLATPAPTAPIPIPAVYVPSQPAAVDHQAIGRARVYEQFKPDPRILALVDAPLAQLVDLEGTLSDLLAKRYLDAEGVQLDRFGALYKAQREGRGDAAYLTWIKAWIAAWRSSGTVDEIYGVLNTLYPSIPTVAYEELLLDPAGQRFSWTAPLLPNVPASHDDVTAQGVQSLLRKARGGAIKTWFFWWPRAFSRLFRLGPDSPTPSSLTGLAPDDLSTGGHLAGQEVV